MYIVYIIIICILVFFIWASADVGSGVYLKSYCQKKTDERMVAITFDDGPEPGVTEQVLDVLKAYHVKATFFLIGNKAELYPHLVKRIINEGHVIGNHTYSHSIFNTISSVKKMSIELERTNQILYQITGLKIKMFRPPFGVTNPLIGASTRGRFLSIGWSIRSMDTIISRTREKVCSRIVGKLQNGAVILLHDRCKDAHVLLEMLLQQLNNRKFTTTTVDELFKISAYED